MFESFDPYYQWLGIPPEEQPANHYRLLGIKWFEDNVDVISAAVDRQMLHLRTYQIGNYSDYSQRLMNEVVSAKLCLLDPKRKATYDQKLLEGDLTASIEMQKSSDSPAFGPRLESLFDEADQAEPGELLHKTRRKHWKPSSLLLKLTVSIAGGILLVLLVVVMASWLIDNVLSRLDGGEEQAPVAVLPEIDNANVPKPPVESDKDHPPKSTETPSVTHVEEPSTSSRPNNNNTAEPSKRLPAPNRGLNWRKKADKTIEAWQKRLPDSSIDGQSDPQAGDHRIAVPAEDARQKARLLVEERHQVSLAQGPLAQVRLAKRLLQSSGGGAVAADEAVRYEMLDTASKLAAEGGDLDLSFKTIDTIAKHYDIDPMAVKISRLGEAVAIAQAAPRIRQTVDTAGKLVDKAVELHQFEAAQRIIDVALPVCNRPAGRQFRKDLVSRRRDVRKQQERFDKIQEARKTLQTAPDDEQSNLLLGSYLCFDNNDWSAGLPHLSKGSDKGLAQLARRELEDPPKNTDEEIRLADDWWTLAATRFSPLKRSILLRAAHWYKQAQPKLTVGPRTKHVDNRLQTIMRLTEPKPE